MANKQVATLNTVRQLLMAQRDKIALALPKHLTPERMLRIASTAMERTPKLLECTPESLVRSIVVASQLGLECDGVMGEGALVPYKGVCQFQPMYQGLVKLARNSGEIVDVYADVVYDCDTFKLARGLHPDLVHEPNYAEQDSSEMLGFYACAVFKSGYAKFEYMTKGQVDGIRARSKARDSGPWVTDYLEMGKKTVVIRLTKLLPKSAELSQAVATSHLADAGEDQGKAFDFDLPVPPEPKPEPRGLDEVLPKSPEPNTDNMPGPDDGVHDPGDVHPAAEERQSLDESNAELAERSALRKQVEKLFPQSGLDIGQWDEFVREVATEHVLPKGTVWQDFPPMALRDLIEGLELKAKG